MFSFLKGKKVTTIDKDEIAKLLSTNKEALEAFENAYTFHALNPKDIPENFFEVNSRQAVSLNANNPTSDNAQLEDIKERIVNELMNECAIWKFDGKSCNQ